MSNEDDEITPPQRKRTLSNAPTTVEDFDSPNTGRVRLVVREEIEHKINGSLERLEKSQRWVKSVLYFGGLFISIVFGAIGVDHWVQSVAKKQELMELQYSVEKFERKVDHLSVDLNEIKEELKQQPKGLKK